MHITAYLYPKREALLPIGAKTEYNIVYIINIPKNNVSLGQNFISKILYTDLLTFFKALNFLK